MTCGVSALDKGSVDNSSICLFLVETAVELGELELEVHPCAIKLIMDDCFRGDDSPAF